MFSIFIFLGAFSFSHQPPCKKFTYIPSTTNHLVADIGFYDILVRGGETITSYLSNGNNRLFIVIPSHPDVSIEEIKIDDISVSEFSGKRGFIINGNENVTFKMKSSKSKSILQVNAWLIPSTFCPTSAIYTYGSRTMKLEKSLSKPDFCIFSPTLDSKNNNFNIEYAIKEASTTTDGSSLYKFDYSTPEQTTTGTKTTKYKSGGPFFIQFNFNDHSKSEKTTYQRKTKPASFKDKGNKCTIDAFYRCTKTADHITCEDDQTGENVKKTCTNLLLGKTELILTATFCTIGGLAIIAAIVLCSIFCSCCACCCCNRSKKKVGQRGKKSDKNDRKSDSSSKSENSDSESSNKSEEEEEEENGENERSKFDLYKELKKLYEKQEKAAADLSKKQMGEVAKLKKLREVTKQEKVILDTFHNQIDERYRQEGDQCHQLHEQQLQELKLFEEMPNSVDLQHNDPNDI